jgi:hypothetical protein
MPLHEWGEVDAGLFHHFHQDWSVELTRELNRGRLPKGYSALIEQRTPDREPDVLAVERRGEHSGKPLNQTTGPATLAAPASRFVHRSGMEAYAAKANRIVIRHRLGRIVAVVEIISPGNKSSRKALREFVDKTLEFLNAGIHVLIVDLHPPTRRDPQGIHQAIWQELEDAEFTPPAGKDRILASYKSGDEWTADVVSIGVGDDLPDMPLFLAEDWSIAAPLESTYRTAWDASPEAFREAVVSGVIDEDL